MICDNKHGFITDNHTAFLPCRYAHQVLIMFMLLTFCIQDLMCLHVYLHILAWMWLSQDKGIRNNLGFQEDYAPNTFRRKLCPSDWLFVIRLCSCRMCYHGCG